MKITPNPNTVSHIPASHGGLFSINNPTEKIIDFSSNVNPLGSHPGVKKYLKKQLNQIHVYPDSESTRLRSNLKWFTGINTSQILIGNGATEIIYNFCSAFVNKKSKVLIPCPTFSEYEKAVKFFSGKIIPFKSLNLNNDFQKFTAKIPIKGIFFVVFEELVYIYKVQEQQYGALKRLFKYIFMCCFEKEDFYTWRRSPEPIDVYWDNLGVRFSKRFTRACMFNFANLF